MSAQSSNLSTKVTKGPVNRRHSQILRILVEIANQLNYQSLHSENFQVDSVDIGDWKSRLTPGVVTKVLTSPIALNLNAGP